MKRFHPLRAGWLLGCLFFMAGLGEAEESTPPQEAELPMLVAQPAFDAVPQIEVPRIDFGATPMVTLSDWKIGTFRIPAPRSLIVSSDNVPLATNRIGKRLVCRLLESSTTGDEAVARVEALAKQFNPDFPLLEVARDEVRRHFEHRPWVDLPVSGVLPESYLCGLEDALPEDCALESIYVREYPEAELTAHLIGYIGVSLPDQHGPLDKFEYAFPPREGRAGMEKTLDQMLRGRDGEVTRLVDPSGVVRHQEKVRETEPGDTLVLTLHLGMQKLAYEQLRRSGRPGAFVAVNAESGDVLAMVSYPSFDPNLFEGGISSANYRALSEDPKAPLFDRAVSGVYPPGSIFKPIVALAGMSSGDIDGTRTLFTGPAGLLIDGRYFKNHSSTGEGLMDVRYALIRSCNTWFYQAALKMGAGPISNMCGRFGLGQAPDLPLPSVATGNIPDPAAYGDPRSLANFSIGQGQVLVSPVQMAYAMAGIANGSYVPRPRLIRETVNPHNGETVNYYEPSVAHTLGLFLEDLDIVRDGMWGVVNHGAGTARSAAMRSPVVYGKTGTSQWASGGKMRSLAWFSGWVDAEHPKIAFVSITQAAGGESLSGGRSAAPIAAGVLRKIYQEPDNYAVTVPERPTRTVSTIVAAAPLPPEIVEEERVQPESRGGGLLRFIFGKGRRNNQHFPERRAFSEP